MSKTKTKTATTAHGEVKYETIECESCGNEAAKSEASRFIMMHDIRDTTTWLHDGGYKEFEVYDYTEGWACQYCTNSPASFPENNRFSRFKKQLELQSVLTILSSLAFVWILVLVVLTIL